MSRVKGPKNGTVTTVKFNGKGKILPSNVSPKALMLLSIVGNEYCTGTYLNVSIELAVKDYDLTTFLIADEVYWHNIKQSDKLNDFEISALKEHALEMGDNYFRANFLAFLAPFDKVTRSFLLTECENKNVNEQIAIINHEAKSLPKKFEIVRWRDWVNTEIFTFNYKENKKAIEQFYQQESFLKNSIELTASDFAARHKKEGNEDLWRMRSIGYLTEESPAVILLATALLYNFIIYPGDMIPPFQATKDYLILMINKEPSILRYLFKSPAPDLSIFINWLQPFFRKSHMKLDSISDINASPAVETGQLIPLQLEDLPKNIGFFSPKTPKIQPTSNKLNELIDKLVISMPTDKEPTEEDVITIVKEIAPTIFSLPPAGRLKALLYMNTLMQELNDRPNEDPYNMSPLNPIK
ncbi:MAG: hypothetical protein H0T84_04650 [Tatlockia sp.]|nr:hypothetical protein [Tatlockia sp.]